MNRSENIFTALMLGCVLLIGGCGDNGSGENGAAQTPAAPIAVPAVEPAPEPMAEAAPAAEIPAPAAEAQEHIVYAQATSFDPIVLFINPGDTVKWTNMSPIHDTVSLEGLIPEGATPWQFPIGENASITLDVEGVYIYKCTPHYAVGMVGAIVVGQPVNLEQVKTNATGRAKGAVIKVERALAQR